MNPKVPDTIDDRTRGEIGALYQIFYRECICHWTNRADQWDRLIKLVRCIAEYGICKPIDESTKILNRAAKETASNLLKAIDTKDLSNAVVWAIRFGHLFRYGYAIVDDHDIKVGQNVILGGKHGAAKKHGDPADRIKRNKEIQELVTAEMTADPKLPYEKAKRMAAEKFGVSPETVKKVTRNPRPRSVKK